MSEALSTFEIEDVLSSIRRLVSEDLRPTHKLVSAALQSGASKLILTPALRVVANEAPGFVHTADDLEDPGDLQSVLDSAQAAEPAQTAEFVPMFGSVRLQEMADVQADGWSSDGEGQSTEANFLASAMSRINGLDVADAAVPGRPETIEKVVAAVGAAVGPDEWEVDGGEPAPHAKMWADSVWNSTDAAQTLLLFDPVEGPVEATDPENDGAGDGLPENSAQTATLAPEGGTDGLLIDTFDKGDSGLIGQDTIIFHDDVIDAVLPGDTAAAQISPIEMVEHLTDEDAGAADALDDSAGFLNEDMLREIVRDMVQAELQGALGERITRNVRKLVRAEISRALASRELH